MSRIKSREILGFGYPAITLSVLSPVVRSRPLCEALHFARWTGQALSGMALTALNIDKYIYFAHPLKYRLITSKCAIAVGLLMSVLSVGYVRSSFLGQFWCFDLVVCLPVQRVSPPGSLLNCAHKNFRLNNVDRSQASFFLCIRKCAELLQRSLVKKSEGDLDFTSLHSCKAHFV